MNEDGQTELKDLVLTVTTGGRRYDIHFADFSASDEMEYEQATGATMMETFLGGRITSYKVAGLVWLARKRAGESKLQFKNVARSFKYGDLDSIVLHDGTEEDQATTGEDLHLEDMSRPEG